MSRVWGRGALARAQRALQVATLFSATAAAACSKSEAPEPPRAAAPSPSALPEIDEELVACRKQKQLLLQAPQASGAPVNGPLRSETLGRARGEPGVWIREPAPPAVDALPHTLQRALGKAREGSPDDPKIWNRRRIAGLLRAFPQEKQALRALLLREGYVYSSDPLVALALTFELKLESLFEEQQLVLRRGSAVYQVESQGSGRSRHYVYRTGPFDGQRAELLFGDWVGVSAPGASLALDVTGLSDEYGAERVRIDRLTARGSLARLRIAGEWFTAILDHPPSGAVAVRCLDEEAPRRAIAAKLRQRGAWRRAAMARLRASVDAMLRDGLRFDRPRGEEGPDRDGELRPVWYSAYRFGQSYFRVEETSYSVFDADGTPTPPQVCVDFVLESFERASGTWFTPKGSGRERRVGGLDFNEYGIKNRKRFMMGVCFWPRRCLQSTAHETEIQRA